MKTKRVLLIAAIALAIYLVVMDPRGSADGVQAVVFWLRDAAESMISFLRNLFR